MLRTIPYIGLIIICLLLSCQEDDLPCQSEGFSPNIYKHFMPYSIGDELIYSDSLGNSDTVSVLTVKIEKAFYNRRVNCGQESESFFCEVEIKYDSLQKCVIRFDSYLAYSLPYLRYEQQT